MPKLPHQGNYFVINFSGMKAMLVSSNAVLPAGPTGKAERKDSNPCSAEGSTTASERMSTTKETETTPSRIGNPLEAGEDHDVKEIASLMSERRRSTTEVSESKGRTTT